MKRIGIVGYYDYGNFGDDLMAVAVARIVSAQSAQPVILTANRRFEDYGVEVQSDPVALVAACDAIVLGGGGALLERRPQRIAAPANQYSALLARVAERAARFGVPLFAVSIGGDGRQAERRLRPGIVAYLTAPVFQEVTVRLRDDVACLERLGARATYYPDVVLCVREFFPELAGDAAQESGALGLQCDSRGAIRQLARLASQGRLPRLLLIHASEAESHGKTSELADALGLERYAARDVVKSARVISRLQAFIGSRLHIGVLAAALGVPFAVARPQRKVLRFFEDLGVTAPEIPTGLLAGPKIPAALDEARVWINDPAFQQAVESSRGHVKFIQERVCG